MANLIKRCTTSLWSSLNQNHLQLLCHNQQHTSIHRSIFTSPTLLAKTRKRRKRYPFFWLQDQYRAYYDENLTPKNEEFFQQFLKNKYSLNNGTSPLKTEPWNVDERFTNETARVGLIAKKLGTFPMWTKEGRRLLTTCLMVEDNHVIKYHPPEEYEKIGRPIDRRRFKGLGLIVVGSESKDPRMFTAEYNGLFNESGVMPKKKLSRFFITHNARIEPGTPLLASHFRPGMFVDIYGKTKEWGPVGLRVRYKLKLGQKTHGATKSHNRIGSIGRGRKECGPLKGRRMPGHHGGERRIVPGLKVWRINTKQNLIYVQGPSIPGLNGNYVNIMDSRISKKTPSIENPPPFPTVTVEENSKLDHELCDVELHQASDPSIVFEISEEEKKAAALAARRFGKAKTAQKVR